MSGSRNEETHDSVAHEQHPEKRRQDAIKKLEVDRLRSRPEEQFNDEVEEVEPWLKEIIGERPGNKSFAKKIVEYRWRKQKIWRDEFEAHGPRKWKHEDPPVGTYEKGERANSRPSCRFVHQISLEHERMLETMATPPDFKISPKDPSEDPEEGLKAYYQALGPEIKKKRSQPPPDIDTKAYWRVQRKRQNRGIWDDAWPMMRGR
ncbi:hypothetical protein NW767_007734 [Fusarium falciforme]|nr:hypothetical protein NW767_007734 [Fusarium falciforme]